MEKTIPLSVYISQEVNIQTLQSHLQTQSKVETACILNRKEGNY